MTGIPAIVIIFGVFFGILALARMRVHLSIAVLAGAVCLNLLAGRPLSAFGVTLARPYLWMLLAVTASIIGLGRHMCEGPNARTILSMARRLGGRYGRLWSLMAAPAFVGLVPMVAGALFSAPMVQQSVSEAKWPASWKAAVNYWFRHVWEYWWPIYPAVIVALTVFQMETWQFMLALIAFTPVTLAAGYWFLLRPRRRDLVLDNKKESSSQRSFALVMLPLALLLASAVVLPSVLARATPSMDIQTRKLFAMLIGTALALAVVVRQGGWQDGKRILSTIVSIPTLKIVLTVGSVILFQDMLVSSKLLPAVGRELLDSGIPLVFVVAFLPMLAGFVTGLAVGFAGIAFPLVVGLMNLEGSALTSRATLVLAFGFGYMGMMISPVHLCLLMTRDFFSASLPEVYRLVFPCVLTMLSFTLLLFGAFHALGW